jgi:hypothetical protein
MWRPYTHISPLRASRDSNSCSSLCVECKYTNFRILFKLTLDQYSEQIRSMSNDNTWSEPCFQSLFVTDRLPVKPKNTTSFSRSKTCLYPIFSTVTLQVFCNYTNFTTCRKPCIQTNDYIFWFYIEYHWKYSILVKPNVSTAYSATYKMYVKRINTSCFCICNSGFSP